MLWFFVAISCYVLFAAVFLVDKYLLVGPIANPRRMAFYVGMLGVVGILFLPFGFVQMPNLGILAIALATGALRIWATYFYFKALQKCEASRIITAVNALQPIFSFWLAWLISSGKAALDIWELAAFALMIVGSVVIVADKKTLAWPNIRASLTSSALFSLSFIGAKMVYLAMAPGFLPVNLGIVNFSLDQAFFSGFLLMGFGSFAAALAFLFFRDVREGIIPEKSVPNQHKTPVIFLSNQAAGALAFILQNYAVALAPLMFVPVINALAGVQYVFLFIFSTILSYYFPRFIREKTSPAILVQKLLAIALIIIGMALFALK